MITEYGKPAAYIIDVQSYEKTQQRMVLLENIARGEKAIQDGRTITHHAAQKALKRWLE